MSNIIKKLSGREKGHLAALTIVGIGLAVWGSVEQQNVLNEIAQREAKTAAIIKKARIELAGYRLHSQTNATSAYQNALNESELYQEERNSLLKTINELDAKPNRTPDEDRTLRLYWGHYGAFLKGQLKSIKEKLDVNPSINIDEYCRLHGVSLEGEIKMLKEKYYDRLNPQLVAN